MLHPTKNIGRPVVINGKTEEISQVLNGGLAFRLKSEEDGPVVNDYTLPMIESALTLTISLNEGVSWVTLPITP